MENNRYMEVIIIIAAGLMLLYLFSLAVHADRRTQEKYKNKQDADREVRIQKSQNKYALIRKKFESQLIELQDKYGKCSAEINLSGWKGYSIKNSFLVFEEAKIVIIENIVYEFSKILGYTLVDDSTEKTQTFSNGGSQSSSGSVVGRAIVGGIIGGGVGALAGASTAKRNISSESITTTTKSDKYVIYINLDSIDTPMVKLVILNRDDAYKIANILNVIIKRNEQLKV